jgi:hypothetical protein
MKDQWKDYLYLISEEMNEGLNSRRLRGFKEIEPGTYHALPKKFLHNKMDAIK